MAKNEELITTSEKQDKEIGEKWSGGDHPFQNHSVPDDENKKDMLKWAIDDELLPLVDDSAGGIIGYIHHTHIDRIVGLLNWAAMHTDFNVDSME